MELTEKNVEDTAAFRLFSFAETAVQSVDGSNSTGDEIAATEKAAGSTGSEVEDKQVKADDAIGIESHISLEKERGREGVCPARIKEL